MNDGRDLERRGPNEQRRFDDDVWRSPRAETADARLDGTRGLEQFLGMLFRTAQLGDQPVLIQPNDGHGEPHWISQPSMPRCSSRRAIAWLSTPLLTFRA